MLIDSTRMRDETALIPRNKTTDNSNVSNISANVRPKPGPELTGWVGSGIASVCKFSNITSVNRRSSSMCIVLADATNSNGLHISDHDGDIHFAIIVFYAHLGKDKTALEGFP